MPTTFYSESNKNPLSSVEILSPEANLSSSHKTKTTSFRRWALAEADEHRDFLLKTGLKSDFGSVEPKISVAKSNRAYAVSSDSEADLRLRYSLCQSANVLTDN
jgi:hypothetical protein